MLGALLGGLAGLLFPAAGAAAGGAAATGIGALLSKAALPALGAGLGTLATGGSGKDAIRNALLMGAGTAIFPGAADGLRGGLERIFGMGGEEPAAATPTVSTSGVRPRPRPAGLVTMAPVMALPDTGQGMVGMEADARARQPTTLPTLSEMAALDRDRTTGEARRSFDSTLPMMPAPEADPFFAGAEMFERRVGLPVDMDAYLARENRRRNFAQGGAVDGPGTGTSDSIPAEIYQDGKPVQKAKLSDGEFVMTAAAVKGAGNGNRERGISRMYELMRRFESGEMA